MVSASTMRRFQKHERKCAGSELAEDHGAAVEGRTRYPAMVQHPSLVDRILKSGHHNAKIGRLAIKSRWAGMPIYTLTLEERATCPRTCLQWRTCYGNKMHFSTRVMHGPFLEARLQEELAELQEDHPDGFIVRLHVLGDFYSAAYVHRWAEWLCDYPALHAYGYTAWPRDSEIGALLETMSQARWDRFAIRFSGCQGERATEVVERPADAAPGAVVCPAQVGRTDCCGTCGLCWQTRRPIAFLEH
ncbi:hypothetical protein ACFOGJ_08970 [Marinibaculum pumilum]|uniref:Uncharacterized protein n=1 Tax=Marinibaculum pumilum TaxID=1766165 RepID=A0ABV7KYH9_9PROT